MRYFILSFFVLTFLGCSATIEEPSLVNVTHVNVKTFDKDLVDVDAYLVFHNPNKFDLDVSSANIVANVDGIPVANIIQSFDLKMLAEKDFEMPVNIKMNLKKLYEENPLNALGKGLQIMSSRSLDVKFTGTIKVGKGIAKITAPVEKELLVKF